MNNTSKTFKPLLGTETIKGVRPLYHQGMNKNQFQHCLFALVLMLAVGASSANATTVTTFTDRATWQAAVDAISGSVTQTETLDLANFTHTECTGNNTGCTSGLSAPISGQLNFSGESINTPLLDILLEFNGTNTGNVFVQPHASIDGSAGAVDGTTELNGGGTTASNFILKFTSTGGNVGAFGLDFALTASPSRYDARVDFADATSSALVSFANTGFVGFIASSFLKKCLKK